MRFTVESWSPEYGVAADTDQLEAAAEPPDLGAEVPPERWAPITPSGAPAHRVTFVDGVRRIDASVWIADGDRAHAGVCASVAAGAVIVNGAACVTEPRIDRALIAAATTKGDDVMTAHGRYRFVPATGGDPEAFYLAIHELMTALESDVAARPEQDLVVFDGPLRSRTDPSSVGYVKTQHVQYLPDDVLPIVAALHDGQRTPLFFLGGRSARWSCYLRLPGPRQHPWSGIVRIELPARWAVTKAAQRADLVAATLPRFASEPHKEPRAPQNLYPIAGLEHRLRHLLGDQLVLDRALRRAAQPVLH